MGVSISPCLRGWQPPTKEESGRDTRNLKKCKPPPKEKRAASIAFAGARGSAHGWHETAGNCL